MKNKIRNNGYNNKTEFTTSDNIKIRHNEPGIPKGFTGYKVSYYENGNIRCKIPIVDGYTKGQCTWFNIDGSIKKEKNVDVLNNYIEL